MYSSSIFLNLTTNRCTSQFFWCIKFSFQTKKLLKEIFALISFNFFLDIGNRSLRLFFLFRSFGFDDIEEIRWWWWLEWYVRSKCKSENDFWFASSSSYLETKNVFSLFFIFGLFFDLRKLSSPSSSSRCFWLSHHFVDWLN